MALTTQSVGPKILWLRRNEPEVWARVDWVTTASSYLTFKMTGEKVIDRRTASHFAPLIDIRTLEWSPRLAGKSSTWTSCRSSVGAANWGAGNTPVGSGNPSVAGHARTYWRD